MKYVFIKLGIVLFILIATVSCNKTEVEANSRLYDEFKKPPSGGGILWCVDDCLCEDESEGWQCTACIYSSYACETSTDCDCVNPRPKSNSKVLEDYSYISESKFDSTVQSIQTVGLSRQLIVDNYDVFYVLYLEGWYSHPDTLLCKFIK